MSAVARTRRLSRLILRGSVENRALTIERGSFASRWRAMDHRRQGGSRTTTMTWRIDATIDGETAREKIAKVRKIVTVAIAVAVAVAARVSMFLDGSTERRSSTRIYCGVCAETPPSWLRFARAVRVSAARCGASSRAYHLRVVVAS